MIITNQKVSVDLLQKLKLTVLEIDTQSAVLWATFTKIYDFIQKWIDYFFKSYNPLPSEQLKLTSARSKMTRCTSDSDKANSNKEISSHVFRFYHLNVIDEFMTFPNGFSLIFI